MTATAEQEDEYNACFDQPRAASDSDSQQWDNSTLVTRYTATTAVTATATATADTASISSFAPHVAAQLTLALLLSSIILVTLAGNVLVVVAIYRFRKLKKQRSRETVTTQPICKPLGVISPLPLHSASNSKQNACFPVQEKQSE